MNSLSGKRSPARAWISAFCVIPILAICGAVAEPASNFSRVTLPRGVSIEIPKGWWLLGKDHNRLIQTTVEASMDLSGVGMPDGEEVNLIAANSMPRSTYAAVRVDSATPVSLDPDMASKMTPAEIREFENEMYWMMKKMLPMQGLELIEFKGARLDTISGHPALVTEYRRTGPKGPVFVQVNMIFTDSQDIRVNLSYRESEVVFWGPVVQRIRQSIVISKWP